MLRGFPFFKKMKSFFVSLTKDSRQMTNIYCFSTKPIAARIPSAALETIPPA